MRKQKLNLTRIDFPLDDSLILLGDYIPFSILKQMFRRYKLILSPSDSDIIQDVYYVKKDKTMIGTVSVIREKEFPVGSLTTYITQPSTSIIIDGKYRDEVLEAIQERFELKSQKFRCPNCKSTVKPIAKRAVASYGRRPYSTELSYNCPKCGYQFWPRK